MGDEARGAGRLEAVSTLVNQLQGYSRDLQCSLNEIGVSGFSDIFLSSHENLGGSNAECYGLETFFAGTLQPWELSLKENFMLALLMVYSAENMAQNPLLRFFLKVLIHFRQLAKLLLSNLLFAGKKLLTKIPFSMIHPTQHTLPLDDELLLCVAYLMAALMRLPRLALGLLVQGARGLRPGELLNTTIEQVYATYRSGVLCFVLNLGAMAVIIGSVLNPLAAYAVQVLFSTCRAGQPPVGVSYITYHRKLKILTRSRGLAHYTPHSPRSGWAASEYLKVLRLERWLKLGGGHLEVV